MTSKEILSALSQGKINAKDAFRMIKALKDDLSDSTSRADDPCPEGSVKDWVYSTCESTFRMDGKGIVGSASFIDLGANSLLLQELIRKVEAHFRVVITADQFMAALSTVDALIAFIESRLGAADQEQIKHPVLSEKSFQVEKSKHVVDVEKKELKRHFSHQIDHLNADQKQYLQKFIAEFSNKTKSSKVKAEKSLQFFSDQRSGWFFTPELKDIHYPLVFEKAHGASLKDIDGNEYLDMTGDLGVNLFGHADDSIQVSLVEQFRKGLSLSTSSPLLAEAAEMFCEMTGMDRVVFTQSGTEAVMSALRLARAATNRSKIVKFNGAFHGHFDGILISESSIPHDSLDGICESRPHFPGTPQAFAEDVIMLDYDSDQSIQMIESLGNDLAAILVEPIQSRNPEIQPKAFLQKLRDISLRYGIVLIFDEMITGFRVHPRGIQGYYGIDCDLCTYGKVITGGLSGGCVAGNAEIMEWVNGGNWQFGDHSRPSLKTTFIAGTHTQNPAVIAGIYSVLKRLNEVGPAFQEDMNRKTSYLVECLNRRFVEKSVPLQLVHFGSLFRFRFLGDTEGVNDHEYPLEMAIFSKVLLSKGILYNQQGNCFLTAAHGEAEIETLMDRIFLAVDEMMTVGFFKPHTHSASNMPSRSFSAFPTLQSQEVQSFTKRLPLSVGQQGLYFEYQVKENQRDLNMPLSFRMNGELDFELLKVAFENVQKRHSALRTNFEMSGDAPVQIIHNDQELYFIHEQLEGASTKGIKAKIEEAYSRPYDLQNDNLFRVFLFSVSAQEHYLLLVIPHILADGFSLQRIVQDFLHFYGKGDDLRTPLEYDAFIDEEAAFFGEERSVRMLDYWKEALAAPLDALQLPTDYVRTPGFEAGHIRFEMTPDQTEALKKCAREQNCTLFTIMFSAYAILLHKYSGQSDVLIDFASVPVDRTTKYGQTLGYFINKLCLRAAVDGDSSISSFLKETGAMILKGTSYRDYPFPILARELNISGQAESLFRAMINMDIPFDTSELSVVEKQSYETLGIEAFNVVEQVWPRDLFLNVIEEKKTLNCVLGYNTRLFSEQSVELMQEQFKTILDAISNYCDQRVSDLFHVSDSGQKDMLEEWNAVVRDYPSTSVHQLFEQQVEQYPDHPAVQYIPSRDNPQSLSYSELNDRSNQLASYLLGLNVNNESLVAICMERSPDLLVSMLATLKIGAAYLPIDEGYPTRRKAFMLRDAECSLILTQENFKDKLPETEANVLCVDSLKEELRFLPKTNLEIVIRPDQLAYVMYTSGSTGDPKGVMIPHRAINRLVCNSNYVDIKSGDSVAQLANTAFDASTFEIWGPLLNGGKTVIFDKNVALSPHELKVLFRTYDIQTVFVTTALFNQLAREVPDIFSSLRDVLFGGELVDTRWVREILSQGAPQRLLHVYGPTECTTYASWYEIKTLEEGVLTIPIGGPLSNTTLYVLDEQLNPCPPNIPGELYVGGDGLALGYLRRPDLTAERFVTNPFDQQNGAKIYKTGDRVRLRPDEANRWVVEFIGRLDNQVKLRGFRIEIGEIEMALSEHPRIRDNVVILKGQDSNDKSLVAYIVTNDHEELDHSDIRRFLWDRLPEYMIPSSFVRMEGLPLNENKKVDRKALPEPDLGTLSVSNRVLPKSEIEQQIAEVWKGVLKIDEVGIHDNFFDLGGHSLLLIEVCSKLRGLFGDEISIVKLFNYPNIHDLVRNLSDEKGDAKEASTALKIANSECCDVAIIGMSGRFPGANDLKSFWENLENGVESIRFYSDEELVEAGIEDSLIKNPAYVKAFGKLDNVELFDAEFFGYSPAEAELMDPQHRLILQCAWESFENAGYDINRIDEKVGVFAGASRNTYFYNHIYQNKDILEQVDQHQLLINNGNEFIPTRLSYKFNLRGPSINVQTACSTSLVAVHMACRSLLNGECSMALAGGATVDTPQVKGYLYQPDGIDSPDGHCRAFDSKAQGSVSGNGVGMVLLKKLDQALLDGDTIHAVIKRTAINNDGTSKVGYTAPGIDGQAEVVGSALGDLDTESIRFIETHGTGTPLGDPVEVAALMQAYQSRTSKVGFCSLSAVKTNIGHLDAAAGVTGLIKSALVLKNKKLPPVVHFEEVNPQIQLQNSPFKICSELTELVPTDGPLRGAVSSFGIGGTNAHAILEEAPDVVIEESESVKSQLIIISAKSDQALDHMSGNLAKELSEFQFSLADVAYTLQVGRAAFPHRRFVVSRSTDEACKCLAENDPAQVFSSHCDEGVRDVAFLFPGVGDHYEDMTLDLYLNEPVFRTHFDLCCEYFKTLIKADLREVIFPNGLVEKEESVSSDVDFQKMLNRDEASSTQSEELLKQARYNQPAVFSVEYALARLWMSWGVKPVSMLGYSLGEYVAACISGVFSVEDAMELLAFRSQMIQDLPPGAMLAVLSDADTIGQYLKDGLSLAIHSTSRQCVVAGTEEQITSLQETLNAESIASSRLPTSHPLHTPAMEVCRKRLIDKIKTMDLKPPQIPYLSNVTGDWIQPDQACSANYWADHTCKTVLFADCMSHLLHHPDTILLEVGPGRSLSILANQHVEKKKEQIALSSMRNHFQSENDLTFLLKNLGKLWLSGATIDWNAFHANQKCQRVSLPTYPFESKVYWIEPIEQAESIPSLAVEQVEPISYQTRHWLRQKAANTKGDGMPAQSWLIVSDEAESAEALKKQLLSMDQQVLSINPEKQSLSDLQGSTDQLDRIVFLVNSGDFVSLQSQLETMIGQNSCEVNWDILTRSLQSVTGEEYLDSNAAKRLSFIQYLQSGGRDTKIRHIDLSAGVSVDALIPQLMLELTAPVQYSQSVAIRGKHRWVLALHDGKPSSQISTPYSVRNCNFVIADGLSSAGLSFADYLACNHAGKIALLTQEGFPAREEWGEILSETMEDDVDLSSAESFGKLIRGMTQIEHVLNDQLNVPLFYDYDGLIEQLNRFCSRHILNYFSTELLVENQSHYTLDLIRHKLSILPKFEKFFQFMLHVLNEDGLIELQANELIFKVSLSDQAKIEVIHQEIIRVVPELEESLDYLSNCASKYPEALSGAIEAISVLYPEGRGADMVRPEEDESYTYTNQRLYVNMLAECIDKLLLDDPQKRLRILEIGGGNGYLTHAVVQLLKDKNVEYYFTDIGPSLVRYSEENAMKKGYDSFMHFGVLDISEDCCEQGFKAHSFDLIMGLDVVHATPHIAETIRNLKKLLAPHGFLCLIEPVKQQRWIDLAGGLAEGWWYFEDYDLRKLSPLLNFAQWENVLEQQGFPNISSFPETQDARERTDAGLFIAQQGKYCSIDELAAFENSEQWISHRIRSILALEAKGVETLLLEISEATQLHADHMENLRRNFGRIHGVLYDLNLKQNYDLFRPLNPEQMVLFCSNEKSDECLESFQQIAFANLWMEQNSVSINRVALLHFLSHDTENVFFQFTDYASVLHEVLKTGGQGSYTLVRQNEQPVQVTDHRHEPEPNKTIHQRPNLMNEYVAPGNHVEETVVGIWEKVLGVDRIGVFDEFASLGGDSLIAIRITSHIRDALKVHVPVKTLMQQPTIAALCENITAHLISQPVTENESDDEEDFVEGKL